MFPKKRFLAFAFMCVLLLGALTGCGGVGNSAASTPAYTPTPQAEGNFHYSENMEPQSDMEMSQSEMKRDEYADSGLAASPSEISAAAGTDPQLPQKLVYNVYLDIETLTYDDSTKLIESLCADYGGYVENSSVMGSGIYSKDLRGANYTLRIPAEKLDGFQAACADVGSITNVSRDTSNMGAVFMDLESRLKSCKTEETRLLELLGSAADLESLIALNSRLSELRYEIESIESNLRGIDSAVSYSTVHVNLREVIKESSQGGVARSFGERVAAASKTAMANFSDAMSSMGVFLFGTLPLGLLLILICLIPIAAVVLIVLLIIRSRRRKARQKSENHIEIPADADESVNSDE